MSDSFKVEGEMTLEQIVNKAVEYHKEFGEMPAHLTIKGVYCDQPMPTDGFLREGTLFIVMDDDSYITLEINPPRFN